MSAHDRLSRWFCIAAVVAAGLSADLQRGRADELAAGFTSPPASARPWVYWFPLDGNLTRAGITADLEAMQRVGLGGVLYMETAQGTPRGPAAFGGPEWRALIQHACREAQRLGLEINMNNDAGWCGSGGPWITPELSMQKLTVSETLLDGPRHFDSPLAQPPAVKDFYRDIAVLAFPTPEADTVTMAGSDAQVATSLPAWKPAGKKPFDGTLRPGLVTPPPTGAQSQYVEVAFPKPFTARTLTLTLPMGGHGVHGNLQVSNDGRKFHTVRSFGGPPPLVSAALPATTARWFRVVFTSIDQHVKKLVVARVDLSPALRIENIQGKASFTVAQIAPLPAAFPAAPAELVVSRESVVDITPRANAGRLTWDVPAGKWTILRIGHTTTGKDNHPAPEAGRGLECDKLAKAGIEAHFAGLMARLVAENRPQVGRTLVTTHIDSWEVGSQNWTPRMREEFRRLRGYDLLPLLPVVTGRVVGSVEISERFLYDLRQTVSDLLIENYAGHMHTLAAQHGLRFSVEAYGEPADDIAYAGRSDEPMGEFWSWVKFGADNSCTEMTSAAHVYGKPIVGAEAFTATNDEKWQGHPAALKDLGDWAFCEGINRFVFHRYAAQPWLDVRPGVSMGPWGLHYERTQTWWEQSRAWHQYLARCQYLLQQGQFVADVCYLQPEGAPRSFTPPHRADGDPHVRPGYNFDGCTAEVVINRMSVKDGRLVLPGGMSYRVLALPEMETITPRLLARLRELVAAGATVVAPKATPPQKSPSLVDYPHGDAHVAQQAAELWKAGRLITGKTPDEVLAARGVPPEFASTVPLRHIHRTVGTAEVYFVANPEPQDVEAAVTFRTSGKRPELWHPDSGRIEPLAAFEQKGACTSVPLRLEPAGSVFVVFRQSAAAFDPVVAVTRDGQPVLPPVVHKAKIAIQQARYGVLDDPRRTRDVRAKVQALIDSGSSRFRVAEMAKPEDPAPMVVKTLEVDYTSNGRPLHATGQDPQVVSLVDSLPCPETAAVQESAGGRLVLAAVQPGHYQLRTALGRVLQADMPPPILAPLAGPWDVSFPPQAIVQERPQQQEAPPRKLVFDRLISWTEHADPEVKYYSGTATYRKTFDVAAGLLAPQRRVDLDLGRVGVMAQVRLNGRELGILWKPPYRVDVTGLLKPTGNVLEARVVNLWINRQIGDEQLPEDSLRNADGITLAQWPQWLLDGKPSPTGRHSFTSHRLWKKDDPLQESGLIGPVRLRAVECAELAGP